MSITIPNRTVRLDLRTTLVTKPEFGHNRWHPDIPPIMSVRPGESISVDLRDGIDRLFTMETTAADLREMSWDVDIPMTGPFYVEGAEPGDLLEVEILDIEPDKVGYTAIIPGFGLLGYRFKEPFLVKWEIENGFARSVDLPGICIPGHPFVGLLGVAPSMKQLEEFTAREQELAAQKPRVKLPNPTKAVPAHGAAAQFGLRTNPPRETGGNMDVRHMTVGSRLTLAVQVEGALFSAGDTHFAQGDGELGGTAIEVSSRTLLRLSLTKASSIKWLPRYPSFWFTESPLTTRPGPHFATMGMPISSEGENAYLDFNLAAEQAMTEMIDYLVKVRGYTEEQAYVISSVTVDLRLSQVVDIPNAIVSAILPLDIFEER
jgi:formamidase